MEGCTVGRWLWRISQNNEEVISCLRFTIELAADGIGSRQRYASARLDLPVGVPIVRDRQRSKAVKANARRIKLKEGGGSVEFTKR